MDYKDEPLEQAKKRKGVTRDHVNAMYAIAMTACHNDPDVMEKADELALAVYAYHDVTFVECDTCHEDEILEFATLLERGQGLGEGRWVCACCQRK